MLPIVLIIVGIISIFYGVAIFVLNSGTWFYMVWFFLGAFCIANAVALKIGAFDAVPVAVKGVAIGIVCVACAAVLALCGFAASGMGSQADDDADTLIVLGAQVKDSGPSVVLQYRLDAAIEYYQAHPGVNIVVTGARGANEPAFECAVMADYLAAHGVNEDDIQQENRATNTVENLAYSAMFVDMEQSKVAVVTNDFHVFRAVGIAKKLGYAHVSGLAGYSNPFYLPNNILREALGIAKDFCAGNL